MKFLLSKILILFALLTLTQGFRLRTKKFTAQRLKKRIMGRKLNLYEFIEIALAKDGLKPGMFIAKGGFGEVYSISNNTNLVVKAIKYKDNSSIKSINIEIQAQSMVKGLAFSLPLCKAEDLIDEGKIEGKLMILPKAERDLLDESLYYYKEYIATRKGFANKVKNFLGETFAKKATLEEKYYALFEPKLKLFVQMALGLEEFHEKKLVHRDIKPENYLLIKEKNGNMRVVLADFGLATKAKEGSAVKLSGTIGYIPYDYDGKKFKLSQKLDTFALGMTYLNMTIPQFFRCFCGTGKCKFKDFDAKIDTFGRGQAAELQNFRNHLNKTAKRQMSKVQNDVEDLVFKHLLSTKESRATSAKFVQLLRKVVPKALFAEVEQEFEKNSISCHGVGEPESITDVHKEFDDIDEEKINDLKKIDTKIFAEIEKDLKPGEDIDGVEENN